MAAPVNQLKEHLTKLAPGGLCVAFSGGVDSALLLKLAADAASRLSPKGAVHAVTVSTPFHTLPERREAAAFAAEHGVPHTVIEIPAMPEEILANPPDRCYLCKRMIFEKMWDYAREHGLATLLDGTNADDLTQYRPGLRALRDLDVKSPLARLGITKKQVREIAAELGLPEAAKPSAPCLATRFPYGDRVDPALLPKIERIENAVKALGVPVVRARVHGDTIRLEVNPDRFGQILENRAPLLQTVQTEGFPRLTLDLAGYRSGSFDNPQP